MGLRRVPSPAERGRMSPPAQSQTTLEGNEPRPQRTLLFRGCSPQVHVFVEPHKRWNKATGVRELHAHLIFKCKAPFAHQKLQRDLIEHGVRGHFSFNLVGYSAYVAYCVLPSAKKLQADLDPEPWSWPTTPMSVLLKVARDPPRGQGARNGREEGKAWKRVHLTFSDLTDCFVENAVRSDKDAWTLAKRRKQDGDDILWNTLGKEKCVSSLVSKIWLAWSPDAIRSTLVQAVRYPLENFAPAATVGAGVARWLEGDWKTKALILHGKGGLGKTGFARALMLQVAPARSFHFINRLDRLRDVDFGPGQGLVVDESCLGNLTIDEAKGLVDIEYSRDVQCRNRDGAIPAGTPRIFTTNWTWDAFWPRAALGAEHRDAVERRATWVSVEADLRRDDARAACALPPNRESALASACEDEDVFGLGGSMDAL